MLQQHVLAHRNALAPAIVRLGVVTRSRPGATCLIPGDHDGYAYLGKLSVFERVARELARAARRRTWCIGGFTGSSDCCSVVAYDTTGKRRWHRASDGESAFRRFIRDAKLTAEPFSVSVKPFLDLSPGWKRTGSIDLLPSTTWAPTEALSSDFVDLFALKLPRPPPKAWRLDREEEGAAISEALLLIGRGARVDALLAQNDLERTNTTINWRTRPGMQWSEARPQEEAEAAAQQAHRLRRLPDGSSGESPGTSLEGTRFTRRGGVVTARFAQLVKGGGGRVWLHLFTARGALGHLWKWWCRWERERRQTRQLAVFESALLRGKPARLPAALLTTHADGLAEGFLQQRQLKAFERLARMLGPSRRSKLRDEHLRQWLAAPRVAAKLLALGANPNAKGSDGLSLLLSTEDPGVAAALLRHGAKAESRDDDGQTALHRARSPQLVKALLKGGCSPHAKDRAGDTPLSVALKFSTDDTMSCVKLLLAAGAKVTVTANGRSLADLIDADVSSRVANRRAIRARGDRLKALLTAAV